MAIKRPDIYEHNNSSLAIVDSDFLRGGFRTAVANLTALYTLSGNSDQLKEQATIVYVSGETKYYILKDIVNIDNSNGWEEFSGAGGTLTGATNGLSLVSSGTTVVLGGILTDAITIISGDSRGLNLGTAASKIGVFDLEAVTAYIQTTNLYMKGTTTACIHGGTVCVLLDGSGGLVTDSLSTGLKYGGDYENNFTSRSLVTKQYVGSAVSGDSNTVDVCNVNLIYTATTSNDFIGVSGASVIYLPEIPKACQRISVADIKGDALTNSITVCGCWGSNGQNINGDSFSTINTDYGSMTFINNGVTWSAVAFIN